MVQISRFRKPQEYESEVLEVKRVTRVMAGGKRFSFRTAVVAGNKKGKVGLGVAKANDVKRSVEKATLQAQKHLIEVPLLGSTIPHEVRAKYSAAKVLLKPAKAGTGIIAGGALRPLLILSGIKDIRAKILGRSSNKINNVRAGLLAFSGLKKPEANLEPVIKSEKPKTDDNQPA